jgi:Rrf2 family protein
VLITQKTKYAIRAVFELARRQEEGPTKIAEIAEAQKIPVRFLEVILNQLKHGGLVTAKRGFYGGFTLKKPPDRITVAEIIQCMESKHSLHCVSCISKDDCDLKGDCAFLPMWDKAQRAMLGVFERTTIQNLLDGDAE